MPVTQVAAEPAIVLYVGNPALGIAPDDQAVNAVEQPFGPFETLRSLDHQLVGDVEARNLSGPKPEAIVGNDDGDAVGVYEFLQSAVFPANLEQIGGQVSEDGTGDVSLVVGDVESREPYELDAFEILELLLQERKGRSIGGDDDFMSELSERPDDGDAPGGMTEPPVKRCNQYALVVREVGAGDIHCRESR